MIDVVIFTVIISIYLFGDSDTSRKEAAIAIGVCGAYLIIYLLVSPFPVGTSHRVASLFGFLPMLSLGAILLPHFYLNSPEAVTRAIGWFGLTVVFFILSIFKLFIW